MPQCKKQTALSEEAPRHQRLRLASYQDARAVVTVSIIASRAALALGGVHGACSQRLYYLSIAQQRPERSRPTMGHSVRAQPAHARVSGGGSRGEACGGIAANLSLLFGLVSVPTHTLTAPLGLSSLRQLTLATT